MNDDMIWRQVREVAAEIGWGDRAEILRRAHLRLKASVPYETLERLWGERAEFSEPN